MNETLSDEAGLDLCIQEIVTIRLIGASAQDAAEFTRLLGTARPATTAPADIVIRFKDTMAPADLTYLGLNDAAFNAEGFYILDKKNGDVLARLPFDSIGQQVCEIVCRRGLKYIPLLPEFILLAFLRKDYVPLHASAFLYDGVGILVTGWAKGGKTEALLAFANEGAQYVGDEWILLSPDGSRMFGLPVPITLWEWQFAYVPNLPLKVKSKKKLLFGGIHLLTAVHRALGPRWRRSVYLLKLLDNSLPTLKRQLRAVESPRALFPNYRQTPAPLDRIFLTISRPKPRIEIEACEPHEIAERMAHSNSYERTEFFAYYRAFEFAFPDRRNEFLETAHERQGALLGQALAGKRAYTVAHPYPVALDELFRQMRPFCEPPARESPG